MLDPKGGSHMQTLRFLAPLCCVVSSIHAGARLPMLQKALYMHVGL
jgi:hypothetical protein